jgi:hypothetical protein
MSEIIVNEIWKPVVGCERLYSVSNLGRVRREYVSYNRTKKSKMVKAKTNRGGYLFAELPHHPVKKWWTIHRLVADAFIGPAPKGLQINHKNGIKTDNAPENLEWVTAKENSADAIRRLGTWGARGEKSYWAKLTVKTVRKMRRLYATGRFTQKEIGERFNVVQTVAGRAIRGITWRHVG